MFMRSRSGEPRLPRSSAMLTPLIGRRRAATGLPSARRGGLRMRGWPDCSWPRKNASKRDRSFRVFSVPIGKLWQTACQRWRTVDLRTTVARARVENNHPVRLIPPPPNSKGPSAVRSCPDQADATRAARGTTKASVPAACEGTDRARLTIFWAVCRRRKEAHGFAAHHFVALADFCFQPRAIEHGDFAPAVLDDALLLQLARGLRHALAAHAEHVGDQLLRHHQLVRGPAVQAQQQPAA